MIFGHNTVQIYHNTATMSEISRDAYFVWGWAKWFAKVSITDEIFAHCTLYSLLTPIPFRAMGVDTLTMLTSWTHIPANRLFNSRQWFKFKFHPLIDDCHAFSLFSFWSNHFRTSSIVSWHWIGIALNVALHICKLFWTRALLTK